MDEEPLPFAISPEARQHLLEYLTYTQNAQDRSRVPRSALTLPTLIWSFGSTVDDIEIGPEIAVGHYREPPSGAGFHFLIDGHRVWIGERTLELLRGRTLIHQIRQVPAPIREHRCLWIEPEPDGA